MVLEVGVKARRRALLAAFLLRYCVSLGLGLGIGCIPANPLLGVHLRRMQDGKTALDYAKQHGPTEIVQLLTAPDTTTPVEAEVRVKMVRVCVCVCVCLNRSWFGDQTII